MTRSTDYDTAAADLVARTLRAVAVDTDVAERDGAPIPVASLPAPIPLGRHRHRRVRRTVAATAAAAAVVAAALVWAGRNPSNPSGPVTSDLGTVPPGMEGVPPELVPEDTAGLTPDREAVYSNGTRYMTQAFLLEPDSGGQILAAVVTWPDGGPATDDELRRIVGVLAPVVGGDAERALTHAPEGETAGTLTLPIGDVAPGVLARANDVLVSEGIGVDVYAIDAGWDETAVDLSWVPGLAPTVSRRYTDGGDRHLDMYTAAGDIANAADMNDVLRDAQPHPVGDSMGWRGALPGGQSLTVWQAAPGTVAAIVADEATAADIDAVVDSVPPPAGAPGEHTNARLVGQSDGGTPWVVEVVDYMPSPYGPSEPAERDCLSLWVGGTVPATTCGELTVPEGSYFDSFEPVGRIDDDVTVVFGVVASTVATVTTDASGAEQATVETQPLDPADPGSLRYAVLIIHGGRDEPAMYRLLGTGGEELYRTAFDLNVVGG